MKYIFLLINSLIVSISSCGQGLNDYSDIIYIDDEFEVLNSNIDEIRTKDISSFWKNNISERRLGFIGTNYRRLHIKFLSIIKNPTDSLEYFVLGKSMVSDNVCEFQGVFKIKESFYIKSLEYPNGNSGILTGEYILFEDPNSSYSGKFEGRFCTYWYKDENDNIKYNDLWNVSAMYNNNQFAGSWKEYLKENETIANWGDSRIPLSGDLDIGVSEFRPADKYVSNGWIVFMIANGLSLDRMNIDAARKSENQEWWKEE